PVSAEPREGTAAAGSADLTDERPVLADGVELVGEYEGSGYRTPHHLARRRNGTLIQLTDLLYLVAVRCDGESELTQIAEAVSADYDQTVSPDNVRQLVDEKLRPLGVLADAEGRSPDIPPPDPLLGLKFRSTLLTPRGTRLVTGLFRPLFVPVLVVSVLAALAAFDVWLFWVHGLAQSLRQTVNQPVIFLFVLAAVIVSAALHEVGHAAACRYGGAEPGRMGAGIYVAWPAFYTDVTDAYRLDRTGRLRTDLGGVYFNAMVVLLAAAAFATTGYEPLLLVCFLLQMQIVQQLLPLLRLDGYYGLSDLVGVPDLFRRIGPILRALLPWRTPDASVRELKTHVRVVVTLWVLAVVPLLLANLAFIVLNAPRILSTAWDSAARQLHTIRTESGLALAVGVIQLMVLLVPTFGTTITVARVGRRSAVGAWRWSGASARRRAVVATGALALVAALAVSWWPDGRLSPYLAGERGTVQQGVVDLSGFRNGSPVLRSPREASRPLPPVAEGRSGVPGSVIAGDGTGRGTRQTRDGSAADRAETPTATAGTSGPSPSATEQPSPTSTATGTAASTPSPTGTSAPTGTPTGTATGTPTGTATGTATPTASASPTTSGSAGSTTPSVPSGTSTP
ncbi:MAG: hypothetical protein WB441_16080, partial [Nocardioidaceae bacterium]